VPLLPTLTPTPKLDLAVSALLAALDDYLPAAAPPVPAPAVSLLSLAERPVGIGAQRGLESRGELTVIELRGVRVEATVRFQVWGASSAAADAAVGDLNLSLLGDRDQLWSAGFLRFSLDALAPSVSVEGTNAWRSDADYKILFEFRAEDTFGAESLIARVPIHSDPEERDSLARETSVVTDDLVRWDQLGAASLVLRGRRNLNRLTALAFLPAPEPTGAVTVTRTFDGAPAAPTVYASLAAFLDAVAGDAAPERNGSVAFASTSAFLAVFAAAGDPVELGDWDADTVLDAYEARSLELESPIRLGSSADRLEISYATPAFDQVGVVYLRAGAARF